MVDGSQTLVATAKRGRQSQFTQEIADRICELVATSSQGLWALCREHPELPWERTIRGWQSKIPEFDAQLARAREQKALMLIEQCTEISDAIELGVDTIKRGGNLEIREGDMLGHRKLRIDTRLAVAAKIAPRLYGNKLSVDGQVTVNLESLVLSAIAMREQRNTVTPIDVTPSKPAITVQPAATDYDDLI